VADEMACRELVELVTAYLEGVLPHAERARFEAHLQGCRGCRTYLEQMRQTVRVLGTVPDGVVNPAMQDELLNMFRNWKSMGK
jgi:anti-sigma factor RsiW